MVAVIGLTSSNANADANLLANPSLEVLDGTDFPVCWERSGWGDNAYHVRGDHNAHSGHPGDADHPSRRSPTVTARR